MVKQRQNLEAIQEESELEDDTDQRKTEEDKEEEEQLEEQELEEQEKDFAFQVIGMTESVQAEDENEEEGDDDSFGFIQRRQLSRSSIQESSIQMYRSNSNHHCEETKNASGLGTHTGNSSDKATPPDEWRSSAKKPRKKVTACHFAI